MSSHRYSLTSYVKTIYKESEVERDSREYGEITKAMVRDGNVAVINTTKGPIERAKDIPFQLVKSLILRPPKRG